MVYFHLWMHLLVLFVGPLILLCRLQYVCVQDLQMWLGYVTMFIYPLDDFTVAKASF